jgi:hypothetical protein
MSHIQDTIDGLSLTAQQEQRKFIIKTIIQVGTEEEAVENCALFLQH